MAFKQSHDLEIRNCTFNDVSGNQTNNYFIKPAASGALSGPLPLIENIFISSTPPPAPRFLFGRDDYVNKAVQLMCSSNSARLAILGGGGMGKTSVALTILRDLRIQDKFLGECYFVPCDALSNASLLLYGIMQVLGIPQAVGMDPLTSLERCLASAKPTMLVLDNFETPWDKAGTDVELILERIAANISLTLIVTLRGNVPPCISTIDWASTDDFHPLSSLSPEAAFQAFCAINPKLETVYQKELIMHLLAELDYVPLAIVIMAQLSKRQSCTLLLKRWNAESTALLNSKSTGAGRLSSLETSILLSLKSLKKDSDAVQLLSLLSHLPSGVYDWQDRLADLAPHFSHPYAAASMLEEVSLVEVDNFGTMRVLNPIRQYMLRCHPCKAAYFHSVEKYYYQLITKYSGVTFGPGFHEASVQLLPEKANITSVISFAYSQNPTVEIIKAVIELSSFCIQTQPFEDLLELVMPWLQRSKFTHLTCVAKHVMGRVLGTKSQFSEAIHNFQAAYTQYRLSGHFAEAAQCLRSIGFALYQQTKYTEAAEKLKEAQEQFLEHGELLGHTQCLQNLGDVMRMQCNYKDSAQQLQAARELFISMEFYTGAANCLLSMGNILYLQSYYEEAIEKVQMADKHYMDTGNAKGAARCIQNLGNILHMQEKYKEADNKLQEARKVFERIGDVLRAAQCLRMLGCNLYMQMKFDEATESLLLAQKDFYKIGNIRGATHCERSLGHALQLQCKYSEAIEKLEKANDVFGQIGDLQGAALSLQALGEIFVTQQKYPEAIQKLDVAQKLFEQMGNMLFASKCLQSLSNTYYGQENYKDAEKMLLLAQEQYTSLGELDLAQQCHSTLESIQAVSNLIDCTIHDKNM